MRPPRPFALATAVPLSLVALACTRSSTEPAAAARADAGAPKESGPAMSVPPPGLPPPPADVFAPPPDAEREPNGVARKILARGTGTVRPVLDDVFVDLRYSGWERNGRQFEGSSSDGASFRYDPTDLADGLKQELAQMVEGDKRRIWVPADLAYAKRPSFGNAPRGDMTFDVELVHITNVPRPPKDVAAPPAPSHDVKATKSGLVYQILEKGTGKRHPVPDTRAEVIYIGWTPQGRRFQTSLITGDTATVRVRLLPPGWREAMQLMVEGDKWRLWLPGKLAFGELTPGDTPMPFGPPPGPVVYDVTFVKIVE